MVFSFIFLTLDSVFNIKNLVSPVNTAAEHLTFTQLVERTSTCHVRIVVMLITPFYRTVRFIGLSSALNLQKHDRRKRLGGSWRKRRETRSFKLLLPLYQLLRDLITCSLAAPMSAVQTRSCLTVMSRHYPESDIAFIRRPSTCSWNYLSPCVTYFIIFRSLFACRGSLYPNNYSSPMATFALRLEYSFPSFPSDVASTLPIFGENLCKS